MRAHIEIDSRPFLHTLRHLASRANATWQVVFRFSPERLELSGTRVSAEFLGRGEGHFEITLNKKQARWLAGMSLRKLPELIVVAADDNSLTIHKDSVSWVVELPKQLDDGPILRDLDYLAAFRTIDHTRLDVFGILEEARAAKLRADQAMATALGVLGAYFVKPEEIRAILVARVARRVEYWREIDHPLAAEVAAHPFREAAEPEDT